MVQENMNFRGINFLKIRNRNEKRLFRRMEIFAEKHSLDKMTEENLYDLFALSLNLLPARYTKPGTIVLGDIVEDTEIDDALLRAYDLILENPKD